MAATEGRVGRIIEAAQKIKAKIEADPHGPKADAYRARMEEYRESLDNLQTYGVERPSSKPVGTELSIPRGLFSVKEG